MESACFRPLWIDDQANHTDVSEIHLGAIIERFRSFVSAREFPCVDAKSAMNRDRMEFAILGEIGSQDSAGALLRELAEYSRATRIRRRAHFARPCIAERRAPKTSST